MNRIEEFLTLIRRADFEEIETARDQVTFSDLGPLAAAYWGLETWDQKAALIHLIQDHNDPRFRPIILDILKAPDVPTDDNIILTKAIALCYLDENDNDFSRYYNDTRLIQARADEILREASSTKPAPSLDAESINSTSQKAGSFLKSFGMISILVGLALLAFSAINQQTLIQYRERGMTTQARVTGKWNETGDLCLGVSYFDRPLLEGGELYLIDICEFIPGTIWKSLEIDSQVQVIFLPEDPAGNTILAASLEDENRAPINRFPIGGILVGLGMAALVGYFVLKHID